MVLTEEEIREVFKTFDHDSSGTMNASELNDALQLLCIDLTDEERHDPKYMPNLDGDSETLNEEEFVIFVKEKFEDIDFKGRASDSLGQFDEQGTGTLSRETMMVILTQRGSEPFSEEEANAILDEFDINNDGRYDIVELTKMMYSE